MKVMASTGVAVGTLVLAIYLLLSAHAVAESAENFELPVLVVNCYSEPTLPPFLDDAPECEPAVDITIVFNDSDGPLGSCVTSESKTGDYGICSVYVPFGSVIEVLEIPPDGFTPEANRVNVTIPEQEEEPGELVVTFVNFPSELAVELPTTGIKESGDGRGASFLALLFIATAFLYGATHYRARRLVH